GGIPAVTDLRPMETPFPPSMTDEVPIGVGGQRKRIAVEVETIPESDVAPGHEADIATAADDADIAEMAPVAVAGPFASHREERIGRRLAQKVTVVVARVGIIAAVADLGHEPTVVPISGIFGGEGARDGQDVAGDFDVDIPVQTKIGPGGVDRAGADAVSPMADHGIGILAIPGLEE